MKKILFTPAMRSVTILTLALAALTACTSTDYVGTEEEARIANGERAITFGSGVPSVTRADKTGAAAATDLNSQFYVYAIKNESTDGAGTVGEGNLVYKNYVVKWTDNSAYTTTSNTQNWEYVGYSLTAKEQTNVTANAGAAAQTIKYWDYGASDYTFYAFSALPADIENDKVIVVKNQTVTTGVHDNGYTVTLDAGANLDKLFFAERKKITSSDNSDRTQSNKYGGNVTFRFHNTATKVRVGMYETIPGHTVTIDKFMVDNDGENPAFSDMTDGVTANFAANLQNCVAGTAGTLTVKYVSSGTTENYPTVAFTGTPAKVLTLGTNLKATTDLATSALTPTYDIDGGTYTSVFPNENNSQNLKLKVNYTLTADGTGEKITVEGATAEIPAVYLKWKPGYAYTYLFKISDNSNGYTGPSDKPAGLYPITFDAVEVVAEDGQAEYITTVSEPSITTFGVKGSKYSIGKNEYEAGTDIYATIMDGSSVVDFTLGTNVNVYLATTTDATNFPITEASVAESLAELSTGTKKITTELKNADGTTSFTAAPEKVSTVPSEDGKTTGIKALKLTGVKATTATTAYVIEYIKTPATYNTTSETHTFADANALATWEASNYKLYDNEDGTTSATATNAEKTYYKRVSVKNVGVYAYKVIHVTAVPVP